MIEDFSVKLYEVWTVLWEAGRVPDYQGNLSKRILGDWRKAGEPADVENFILARVPLAASDEKFDFVWDQLCQDGIVCKSSSGPATEYLRIFLTWIDAGKPVEIQQFIE